MPGVLHASVEALRSLYESAARADYIGEDVSQLETRAAECAPRLGGGCRRTRRPWQPSFTTSGICVEPMMLRAWQAWA